MRVLVTGSAGFIGYFVAEALLAAGHEVVGLDNFNAYYPVVLKRARAERLARHAKFLGVEADVADHDRMLEVVKGERVDIICHLAAQAGVRHSLKKPFDYTRANVEGFLSVLEATRHAGLGRLVYASSSSVYGGNTKLPFSEADAVDNPVSLYAATKRANELMAHTYTHLYKFQTVGLRFFTVYGPWSRPDMATWLFADAISQGRAIQVFNHGHMQRDFTYIDDIVAGVVASLTSQKTEPADVLNLGNHHSESVMELVGAIAAELGVEPRIELLPLQPGDVEATYADITRAQQRLDFHPHTPLRAGVAQFAKWWRENQELVAAVRAAR